MTALATDIPALRFDSFHDSWECSPLSSKLAKVIDYRGKAPPKAEQGIPLITARNVRDGFLDFKVDEYIEEESYEAWMRRGIPKPNDVLFTTEAPLGNVALFPAGTRFALGQRIITLQANSECDSIFLFQLLRSETARRAIDDRSTGTTAKGIKSKLFVKIPLCFPSLPEQRKIADFLTAVDGRIAQLVRKKALLEDYKKGVMQQLFTQALRFKDDHGNDFPEWEEKKLGDLCITITKGATPTSYGHSYQKSGINFIKAENISKNGFIDIESTPKITDECHLLLRRSTLMEHDILFSIAGTLGRTAIILKKDLPANTNQAIGIVRLRNKAIRSFITHALNQAEMKSWIRRMVSTGAQPNLNLEQLNDIRVPFSHPAEQTKIADFLSALDRKIASVSTQITETQTWKKGLLQQMFV